MLTVFKPYPSCRNNISCEEEGGGGKCCQFFLWPSPIPSHGRGWAQNSCTFGKILVQHKKLVLCLLYDHGHTVIDWSCLHPRLVSMIGHGRKQTMKFKYILKKYVETMTAVWSWRACTQSILLWFCIKNEVLYASRVGPVRSSWKRMYSKQHVRPLGPCFGLATWTLLYSSLSIGHGATQISWPVNTSVEP